MFWRSKNKIFFYRQTTACCWICESCAEGEIVRNNLCQKCPFGEWPVAGNRTGKTRFLIKNKKSLYSFTS
jgi:hypothetical protein